MRNQLTTHTSTLPGVLCSANGELDGCRASLMADKRNELTIALGPTSITISAVAMIELIQDLHNAMNSLVEAKQ